LVNIFFSLDGIVATMRSKAGPTYRVLETLAEYEKFLEHNDHSIIGMLTRKLKINNFNFMIYLGYFDSDTDSLRNDLVKVAGQLSEKFRFAYTTAKEVLEKAGHSK
jgi:hypothetical protein